MAHEVARHVCNSTRLINQSVTSIISIVTVLIVAADGVLQQEW